VRNPTSAATVGAAIIITTLATCATGWEGPVQRRAEFQCLADSSHRRGGAAVGVHVAQASSSLPTNGGGGSGSGGGVTTVAVVVVLATRQQSKQRQQQQHDNNTTTNTMTNKTANKEGGLLSGRRETMFNTMFFSVSIYVSTPGQCYARQTSKGTFFWVGKVCFYVFM
jgi:hypothetical protein